MEVFNINLDHFAQTIFKVSSFSLFNAAIEEFEFRGFRIFGFVKIGQNCRFLRIKGGAVKVEFFILAKMLEKISIFFCLKF